MPTEVTPRSDTALSPSDLEVSARPSRTPRAPIIVISLMILVATVAQRFGEIVMLTRLDRVMDPVASLRRTANLWDPISDLGALQYQSSGYLLISDLPYALGQWLGAPTWLVQRILIALVIIVALWGFIRLVDELRIGSPVGRVIAGVVFALSPVVLSRVGWRLPEALGPALLPWILLPLVRGARTGSPRRAAARSGIAVAMISGVNAAISLSVLPAAALFLVTRQSGPRRTRLAIWWSVAVIAATGWFIAALLLYARFGPDLLMLTESARDTTRPATLFNALRGSADWLVGLDAGAYLPSASTLATHAVPGAALGVLTALGLAGLTRRSLPERRYFVACLALGVTAIVGATGGLFGNPASGLYLEVLDGPLKAFRNISKFGALITLPVAAGLAQSLSEIWQRIPPARLPSPIGQRGRRSSTDGLVRWSRPAAFALTTGLLLAGALWPLWHGNLVKGPGFTSEPEAWVEAKQWLSSHEVSGVLVVPGQAEASYEWAYTSQTPVEWGVASPWATRSQLPMGGPRAIEYLDAVEIAIERGGESHLGSYLASAGISHVVVPNDTTIGMSDLPAPERVADALERSGLELVAGFGEYRFGFGDLQQVEIYSVAGASRWHYYPADAATWLSGDVESTLAIPREIFGDRPYVLVRDGAPPSLDISEWLITDGNQRVTYEFGLNRNNRSFVLGADDVEINGEQIASQRLIPDLVEHQTTADFIGGGRITASSVGPGPIRSAMPFAQPGNAVDGNAQTIWLPNRENFGGDEEWDGDQWLELAFAEPRSVRSTQIIVLAGEADEDLLIELTVQTDTGTRRSRIRPSSDPQQLRVPLGDTTRLRVTIAEESLDQSTDWIGIAEIRVPGDPIERVLIPPSELLNDYVNPASRAPSFVLNRNRPGVSPLTSIDSEPRLVRRVEVPRTATYEIAVTGSVGRGDELIEALGSTDTLRISASDTYSDQPRVAPRHLVDNDLDTQWRSDLRTSPFDLVSTDITLTWDEARTVDGLTVTLPEGAAMPAWVTVNSDTGRERFRMSLDGTVTFDAVETTSLELTFWYPRQYGPVGSLAVAMSQLVVSGIEDLYPGYLDPDERVVIGCDAGMELSIGDRLIAVSATPTIAQLVNATAIEFSPCDSSVIEVDAGELVIRSTDGPYGLTIDQVVIAPPSLVGADSGLQREIHIDRWDTVDRRVTLGPGTTGIFVVSEIYNSGWTAHLSGTELDTVIVDGWRQGYVIPAGLDGELRMSYAPNSLYRALLVVGVLTLIALVAAAVLPARRHNGPEAVGAAVWPPGVLWLAVTATAIWTTGLLALALLPIRQISKRRPIRVTVLAAASFIIASAAMIAALRQAPPWASWLEIGGIPVAVASAVAYLAVVASVLPGRSDERINGHHGSPIDPPAGQATPT